MYFVILSSEFWYQYLIYNICIVIFFTAKVKLNIEKGDLVKSIFEDVFCRAKVLKKVDKGYLISFIDFGNDEIVNDDAIFELPEELQKVIININ